jgi:segregation and condensation protein B
MAKVPKKTRRPRGRATAETTPGGGADEATPAVTVDELVGPAPAPAQDGGAEAVAGDEAAAGEPPVSAELKAIIESLIYASPEPLSPKAIFKVLDSEPREDVERAIEALRRDYPAERGLQLVEIAGGYQIVTRPDLHEWVRRLFHERKNTRLSVAALETLAVIAYRQPITSAEIAEIRGVNTAGVLSTLVERKLIKTAGRKAVVGRPFLYATTKEFLLRFGLNDLTDLPRVEDMSDVLGFELPGLLNEGLPTDQFLPLGDPEELPAGTVDPEADAAGLTAEAGGDAEAATGETPAAMDESPEPEPDPPGEAPVTEPDPAPWEESVPEPDAEQPWSEAGAPEPDPEAEPS